jgi:hypothetical protein
LRKKTYLECNIVIFYLFWEAVNRNGYLWVRNSAHRTNYYFRAPRLHSVLIEELYLPFHFFQIIFLSFRNDFLLNCNRNGHWFVENNLYLLYNYKLKFFGRIKI